MNTLDPRALEMAQDAYRRDQGAESAPAVEAAITAYLAALSQPQAGEPVAWMREVRMANPALPHRVEITRDAAAADMWRYSDPTVSLIPLYASPQPANPAQVTDAMVEVARNAADDALWKWRGIGERKKGEGLDGMHFVVRAALTAAIGAAPKPSLLDRERAAMNVTQRRAIEGERAVEALRDAADRFDEIRVILIEHLEEPQRTAFWKAVNGREFCRHALAKEGR